MEWLERLNQMKKYKGMTTEEISELSGIPRGTLNKLFAGQTKDPQLNTMRAVVHSLGYTLDDLAPTEPKELHASLEVETRALNTEEKQLIHNYRHINNEGQEKLLDYSEDLVSSGRYANEGSEETVRVFRAARSAENKDSEIVDLPKSVIEKLRAAKSTDEI